MKLTEFVVVVDAIDTKCM